MKRIFKIGGFLSVLFLLLGVMTVSALCVDVTVQNTDEGIMLQWDASGDAYYYEVYRQEGKNGEKMLLAKAQDVTFTDSGVTDGKSYIYTVMPVKTDYSYNGQNGAVFAYRVGNVKITDSGSEKEGLSIKWSAVKGATGYCVLRKAEGETEWKEIGKCSKDSTVYVDSKVDAETEYSYAVKAVAASVEGAVSEAVSLKYIAYPKLMGCTSTEIGIRLKWSKVPSAVYYLVYRKTNGSAWKPYALLDSEYTSYEDREAKAGVSYTYTVKAIDENRKHSFYDDGLTMRFLLKPEIKTAQSDTEGVKLTWTKSAGSQGYAVFRKDFGRANWKLVCLTNDQNETFAVDTTAKHDMPYTYTVRAMWNKNLSAYDEKGVTVRFMQAPGNLQCFTETKYGNVLRWQKNPEAKIFYVYRKTDGGKWKLIGSTDKNIYADSKAEAEGRYYYTVKAFATSIFYSGTAQTVKTFKDLPKATGKMVALTFDDGPSDTITNGVLDVLEEYGAKATFFVVGQNIYYGRNAMTRAAKMGCEIGTHTYSHIDLPSSSSSLIREEIEDTDALIREYTGSPAYVARAPGGALDSSSAATVGKPFFYWTVDTRDWESRDASSVISIVKNNTDDGDIILMHDVYESTLEAVETIVPWLIEQGYQLVTVSELMQYKGGITPEAGVQYYNGFGT